jgi:DNA topoisomerase-1
MGPHPQDGEPVHVLAGRFGPYVKHGKINASLPKGKTPEELTLGEAVSLLAGRAERQGTKPAKRGRTAKSAARAPAKTAKAPAKAGKGKATTAKKAASATAAPRKRASRTAAE